MIIGLAEEPREVETPPGRWAAVILLALLIHLAPMMLLKLSAVPLITEDVIMTVDFSDESLALSTQLDSAAQPPAPAEKTPAAPQSAPAPEPKSAPPQVTPPAAQQPTPAPKKPIPEAPVAVQKPEDKPKPKDLDLDPFTRPSVAFDESKTTKEIPKDAYLSDRTSTAADKGPKDLPRGDPFMDKGESNVIRFQERRGEGNLPALASSDTSGSIKKEGNPDAGKGLESDKRPADLIQPKKPVLPEFVEVKPEAKPQLAPPTGTKDVRIPLNQPEVVALQPKSTETKTTEAGLQDPKRPGELPGALPSSPTPSNVVSADERAAVNKINPAAPQPDATQAKSIVKSREQSELDAFMARIDGKGRADGRGGDAGDKSGINARVGTKGHEGDGTLRPGHDEAVSDVTTVNLESSAAEFDEARFAKKFDAKTAYVKPLARRIDGKWKSERVARGRFRPISGVVTMKIVVRKDGKLLEASEANRTKGIPDEYVASAKLAIERAADPLSEPFSPALADRDKIEFEFNFIY